MDLTRSLDIPVNLHEAPRRPANFIHLVRATRHRCTCISPVFTGVLLLRGEYLHRSDAPRPWQLTWYGTDFPLRCDRCSPVPRSLVRDRRAGYHSRHGFALPPRRLMLLGLTIRDFVLIERLDLAFKPGLCVLTGETGASKSILLDALGLALGMRAESGLVRKGASQAVVAAEFAPAADHPVWPLLAEHGIEAEPANDSLVLRRILGSDGRSRAFIDDEPASVGLLRQVGDILVEIQGQFEQHGLPDQATHRELLDAFGGYERERAAHRATLRERRPETAPAGAAARGPRPARRRQ